MMIGLLTLMPLQSITLINEELDKVSRKTRSGTRYLFTMFLVELL